MLGLGLVRAARAAGAYVARCAAGACVARWLDLRDTGCWCCARGVVRFLAGWFAAGVLQAAGEENKIWKIRDFVNSKFFFFFFFSDESL